MEKIMKERVISTFYKQMIDEETNIFHAYYSETSELGRVIRYYDHNEKVDDLKELKDLKEKFDIFKLKKMNHIPHIIKPINDSYIQICMSSLEGNKYDVNINVGKCSGVIYLPDKHCYRVEYESKPVLLIFVNDLMPAVCVINLEDHTGEVMYPKERQSVQFRFSPDFDFYYSIKNSFVVTEYTINNDKDTTTLIHSDKVFGSNMYYVPVCFTYNGLYIPEPGKLISVIDNYRCNINGVLQEYSRKITF